MTQGNFFLKRSNLKRLNLSSNRSKKFPNQRNVINSQKCDIFNESIQKRDSIFMGRKIYGSNFKVSSFSGKRTFSSNENCKYNNQKKLLNALTKNDTFSPLISVSSI